MLAIDDLRDFDTHLRARSQEVRARLREALAGHRLTLREARVHDVLMPMVGLYTPGWQALPAWSWGFVELVTNEGPVGTGEWSVAVDAPAHAAIQRLRATPEANLLDDEWEIPLFMAWWDLVGQTLDKPLHQLWAELFDVGFEPPSLVPLAAYSWQRFPDAEGRDAVTFESWPQFAAQQVAEGFDAQAVDDERRARRPRGARRAHPRGDSAGGRHRVDSHGTWNEIEARRIMRALEPIGVRHQAPLASLLPQPFLRRRAPARGASGGFHREYYSRSSRSSRRDTGMPISCHRWTPPIVQPEGVSRAADAWKFDCT